MKNHNGNATVERPLLAVLSNGSSAASSHIAPICKPPLSTSNNAKKIYKEIRKRVYYFLERPDNKIAIFYHLLNLVLIVGSIGTSILSTIQSYEENVILKDIILYYELALLSWFTVEYILRVWSCSFLGKYKGFKGKFRFMRGLYMMIDAFVIISTVTTAVLSIKTAYFTILRITRFLQIFRILRLDRQRGDLRTMGRVVYKHRKELVTCYFVGFIILFSGTYLIYIIEKILATDSTVDNMANGLYWACVTVTSVGYGDISPKTWAGKLVTGVFALVGCAFFALPAGILGSGFALQVAKQKKQRRFIKVRNPAAIVIQSCWRCYAVTPKRSTLQGTWYYFFPQILGRDNAPELHQSQVMPGVQEIMCAGYFPQTNNLVVSDRVEKKGWSPLNKLKTALSEKTSDEKMIDRLRKRTTKTIKRNKLSENKTAHNSTPLSDFLNKQYKNAIRFLLKVKLCNSIKTFKNVRYPFVNVQDIMEKNALCHTETLFYLKHIQESMFASRQEVLEIRMILNSLQKISPKIIRKMSESHLANGLVTSAFVPFIDDDDDDEDDFVVDPSSVMINSPALSLLEEEDEEHAGIEVTSE